jgi:uncharacterized membrane protein YfcA
MTAATIAWLAVLFFAAAVLYSSVGHAGASAYLAAMALFGLAPELMRPTAWTLNILVAVIASIRFYRAGAFSWTTLWPFLIGSIPAAFAGGAIALSGDAYKRVVGFVLLAAAWRLLASGAHPGAVPVRHPPVAAAVPCGLAIGLLSGLTGTGGGIFLSPLLILMGWSDPRRTAGVSAAFILINSLAGISGHLTQTQALPRAILVWLAAVAAGGLVGSALGSRRFDLLTLRRLLGAVLVIAGLKMLSS